LVIVGSVLGTLALLGLLFAIWIVIRQRRRSRPGIPPHASASAFLGTPVAAVTESNYTPAGSTSEARVPHSSTLLTQELLYKRLLNQEWDAEEAPPEYATSLV
jgi:hypothetical protein